MTDNKPCSKWLVASDIDGTLNNKKRKLPERNLKAIGEFVEKGGHFTLASSRNPQSMWRHYRNLPIKTPGIVTNGAGIYDFEKREYVDFTSIGTNGINQICYLKRKFPTLDAMVVTKDMLYISGLGLWSYLYVFIDRLTHKHVININHIPKENWGKVIVNGPWWRVKKAKRVFASIPDRDFDMVDTSFVSFEILPKGVNKGSSVLKLAEILGVEKENTAAIGDYYNDKKMLMAVEVSACCGQAPKPMKAIADYVTCHCNEGAVADFLEYLENNIIK
ncbi:MAG: HAD family hydrolase [Clostridia bacterium]|nr:HAD family hydrolase [Clostridia bacterium]MBR5771803.1 HAD family hydrolase [Clostridia bacterium]MBR6335227.1 HAD family hydrolase [Clostridia bacterium]